MKWSNTAPSAEPGGDPGAVAGLVVLFAISLVSLSLTAYFWRQRRLHVVHMVGTSATVTLVLIYCSSALGDASADFMQPIILVCVAVWFLATVWLHRQAVLQQCHLMYLLMCCRDPMHSQQVLEHAISALHILPVLAYASLA